MCECHSEQMIKWCLGGYKINPNQPWNNLEQGFFDTEMVENVPPQMAFREKHLDTLKIKKAEFVLCNPTNKVFLLKFPPRYYKLILKYMIWNLIIYADFLIDIWPFCRPMYWGDMILSLVV